MIGWLLKRGIDRRFKEIEVPIKNSFASLKDDMGQVSQWLNHFKDKHDGHEESIKDLSKRVKLLEQLLAEKQSVEKTETMDEDLYEDLPSDFELEKKLPPAQENMCRVLYGLQREEPNKWISLRNLGEEVWPQKKYNESRSAVIQIVNILENKGYIVKKKVGRSVYVFLRKRKFSISEKSKAIKTNQH